MPQVSAISQTLATRHTQNSLRQKLNHCFSMCCDFAASWHGICKAVGMCSQPRRVAPTGETEMKPYFNSQTLRSMVGIVAAMMIGGTFLVAAAGPALAASQVNIGAESNIVGG
jgi:hypothetical protein